MLTDIKVALSMLENAKDNMISASGMLRDTPIEDKCSNIWQLVENVDKLTDILKAHHE